MPPATTQLSKERVNLRTGGSLTISDEACVRKITIARLFFSFLAVASLSVEHRWKIDDCFAIPL